MFIILYFFAYFFSFSPSKKVSKIIAFETYDRWFGNTAKNRELDEKRDFFEKVPTGGAAGSNTLP